MKMLTQNDKNHRFGRLFLALAILMIIAVPAVAAIAAAAAVVRKVTSRTGNPPFTSAFASGTACSSFSITMTGMTPALPNVSTMSIFYSS